MTNEVEELIIKEEKPNVTYEENIAYLFYKEIWKFLLNINKYDYKTAKIKFKINKKGNQYCIYKSDGIHFSIEKDGFESGWASNYYEGCEEYYIKNLLNTNIDFRVLIKLLYADGFRCDYYEDNNFFVYIDINKYTVNKNIDNVLLKNKVLKKEM